MPRYRDWDREQDQEFTRVRVRKTGPARRSQNGFDDDDRSGREFYRQGSRKSQSDQSRRQNRD